MAKVLLIVEGAKTDVRLMKHLLKIYGISDEHNIVSYKANIHSLFQKMFRNMDPEEVDLLQLLKEHESDEDKKEIFDEKYSDILLIFDLDPQDAQFSPDNIREMMGFFNESSDRGKLYINYPMIESYYHMKSIPDSEYNSYTASMQELANHQYKKRVQEETRNNDYRKFAVNREECNIVIRQNYEKAMNICEKYADVIAPFEYDKELLEKQFCKMNEEEKIYVICTCIFYILDYDSKLIRSNNHKGEL